MIQRMLAFVAAGMGIAATAAAADFHAPVTLPPGSQLEVVVAHTRSGTRTPDPTTITVRYRQEIQPKGDGYVVGLRVTGIDYPPGVTDAAKTRLAAILAVPQAANLSYDTDKALKPLRVNNWQQLAAQRAPAGSEESSSSPAAVAARMAGGILARMSPEQAASLLLREQHFPAAAQGTSLDLGKPLTEARRISSPLGGLADGAYTVELESLDRARNRAVIRISSKLDSASAKQDVGLWLSASKKYLPNVPQPTPEEAAAFKIERSLECRHDMDLVTGLALTSDCTETEAGIGEDLKQLIRVDRWVVTQTLVRPD